VKAFVMSYALRRAVVVLAIAVAIAVMPIHYVLLQPHTEYHVKRSAVLITGASTGIGRAAALALLEVGFIVYAGVRDETTAHELAEKHGPRLRPLMLDVTNPIDIANAFANITASAQVAGGGKLIGLVNNAGTTYKRPLETADLEQVRALFDVNVLGVLAVTQAFLPLLRRARGRVVNIGSVNGIISMPMQGPYSATKHALEALSDTLRQELAPLGVSVSLVSPGYIHTAIRDKGSPPQANASLTEIERRVYYELFEALWSKDAKHRELAPACCPQTDAAIVHALTHPYPRTRYYPSTASVALGDLFPASAAAVLIRLFSIHPSLDRVRDSILARFA